MLLIGFLSFSTGDPLRRDPTLLESDNSTATAMPCGSILAQAEVRAVTEHEREKFQASSEARSSLKCYQVIWTLDMNLSAGKLSVVTNGEKVHPRNSLQALSKSINLESGGGATVDYSIRARSAHVLKGGDFFRKCSRRL
jgi:hypothetical protein